MVSQYRKFDLFHVNIVFLKIGKDKIAFLFFPNWLFSLILWDFSRETGARVYYPLELATHALSALLTVEKLLASLYQSLCLYSEYRSWIPTFSGSSIWHHLPGPYYSYFMGVLPNNIQISSSNSYKPTETNNIFLSLISTQIGPAKNSKLSAPGNTCLY